MSDIRITVGITTYNRPEFLKQAVRSVLKQSFSNFELIISNDYTDIPVTPDVLGIETDSRIKIVNQKLNLGEVRNMNYLLEMAQSEWFVWLADDDLVHPEFFMLANKCINKNKGRNIVAFYSDYSSSDSPDGIFPAELKLKNYFCYDASEFIRCYSARKISLIGSCGIMNTEALKKIGGFPLLGNSFGPYGDTLIPILLTQQGNVCMFEESLMFLRTHADSLSCKSSEFSAYSSAEVDFLGRVKHVCNNKFIDIELDEIVANIIRWFANDEWAVLSRVGSLSRHKVVTKFIKYQLNVNLGRLTFKYKLVHIIFILSFFSKLFFYRMYRKFQSILAVSS